MSESKQKELIWYYRQVPYENGLNKGKLHYEYNWKTLAPEIDKAIKFFEDEGIQPTVRQIHYHFTQLKPPRIPNVKKCYQKLDEFITDERKKGNIEWGRIKEDQRETDNVYPGYWHPEEYLDFKIDKLKNTAQDYHIAKWNKQPNYVEMYVEKIATVDNFEELTKDWEINVRHDKGFGSPEAIYKNCREIVRLMYQEDMQKKVIVIYGGDMDPSGDSMDKVLEEHLNLFSNYDFGFEELDFGYPVYDKKGKIIERNYRLGRVEVKRLFITQEQIAAFDIPLEFDAEVSAKLLGTSIANGDAKDKKGDSRTKGFIAKYKQYMKPGDILPPMSELDAILTTKDLLDQTKVILDENIEPFFDEEIHQREVIEKLKSNQKEIEKLLKDKVKLIEDNDDDNEEPDDH